MSFQSKRAFFFSALFSLSVGTLLACKAECPQGTMMIGGRCHPLDETERDAGRDDAGSKDAVSGTGHLGSAVAGKSDAGGPSEASNDAGSAQGGKPKGSASGSGSKADAGASSDAGSAPSSTPPTSAAPECGNGMVEGAEKCDGKCPMLADCPEQRDPCVVNVIQGDAKTCDAVCATTQISMCASGDHCCPMGCDFGTDSDCSKSCGDGIVEAPETCEPTSSDMSMRCKTECDDGNACTTDLLTGSPTQCNVMCTSTPVTSPINGDKCCPLGTSTNANANNDDDCTAMCGNQVKEGAETCDGDCPTQADCDDGDPCTTDTLVGSATQCNAKCMNASQKSNRCVVVPSGWTVGAVVSDTQTCPSGFDASGDVLHRGLMTQCSDTCSCSTPSGGVCQGSFTATINDSSGSAHNNGGTANSAITGDGTCGSRLDGTPSSGTLASISANALTWGCAGGACTGCAATGTSQPTAAWTDSIRFCPAAADTLTCRDGSQCLQPAAQTCVMRQGEAQCPAGFESAQPPAYAKTDSSASCTCGGCGRSSSQNCNDASWTFTYGACTPTFNVVAKFPSSGGSTSTFSSPAPDGTELFAFIEGDASPGMCNAPVVTATKQFSPSDTRTICCMR